MRSQHITTALIVVQGWMQMTDFGKAIRILRIENDRKQKQDADDLGVTASYISAIENGKKKVSDKYLEYCIKTYGDKDRLIELAEKQNQSIYVFKDVDNVLDLVCRAINEAKDDEWSCVKDLLLDMIVVRCKDCKYYEGTCTNYYINDIMVPLGLDGGAEFIPDEDFYCAVAERKEE